MAVSIPPSQSTPFAVQDTFKLIADLSRALNAQCERARRQLDQDSASPEARRALDAVTARAREIVDRCPALLSDDRPAEPVAEVEPAPAPGATAVSPAVDDAATRECAVSLALTLKLEGAEPADVETWLRQEFGRDDAGQITAEAFGSG